MRWKALQLVSAILCVFLHRGTTCIGGREVGTLPQKEERQGTIQTWLSQMQMYRRRCMERNSQLAEKLQANEIITESSAETIFVNISF